MVIEAYVNGAGQVYDYRIVSGPTDKATRAQVENLLLWSRFEPARRFGQPVPGLAVLSFSGVSVRGLEGFSSAPGQPDGGAETGSLLGFLSLNCRERSIATNAS